MFHQRSGRLDHLQVGLFKNHFLAGTLATRLFAGLLRPADHHTFPKRVETMDQDTAEAVSVGNEQRDGRNSPDDAQHREKASRDVALQRDPSLENDLNQHANERSEIDSLWPEVSILNLPPHSVVLRSDRSMPLFVRDTRPRRPRSRPAVPLQSNPNSNSESSRQKSLA